MQASKGDSILPGGNMVADHRQSGGGRVVLDDVADQGNVTACAECPLNEKTLFRSHSPSELSAVQDLKRGEVHTQAGAFAIAEGAPSKPVLTLLRGWSIRSKTLDDGRRQILDFLLPGDLVGFESLAFPEADCSVEALTDCVFCVFDASELRALVERGSPVTSKLLQAVGEKHREMDERLLSIGQRSGPERLAHLLLRLFRRCEALGMTYGRSLFTPFTQQHLADALGLSLVHTNKTLRRLADANLVRLKSRRLEIVDLDGLAELAGIEPHEQHKRTFV